MKISTCLAALAAIIGCTAIPALADPLPMDTPVTVDGVATVCTGIGEDAQNDPRWKAYPIRVEFSNGTAQYIAGARVTLADAHGKTLVSVDCSGSWVLFQLAPGKYKVSASLLDHPNEPARSASFSPPANGQKRVVLEFKTLAANQ